MARIDLTLPLKDLKGRELDSFQTCLVVNENNEFLKDDKGEPIVREVPSGRSATLKDIANNCLLVNEDGLDGKEKARRYHLAHRIHNAEGPIDLEAEDVTLLKELIGKYQNPLVVGQAYTLLEGKDVDTNKKRG